MKQLMIFLAALMATISPAALAQSEETLKHAATMEAIGKLADAMGKQSEAMAAMAARVGNAPAQQPIFYPNPQAAPVEKDCTGFGGCTVAGVTGIFRGLRDVLKGTGEAIAPLAPFAQAYYGFRAIDRQVDGTKWAATESRLANADNQATLQSAFNGFTAIGLKPAPAVQAQIPTNQYNIGSTSGNILLGGGTQNIGVITLACTPVMNAAGVVIGQSCVRQGG